MTHLFDTIRAEIESYKYTDYLRQLKTIRGTDLSVHKKLHIAVLRSYSAEMLEAPLHLRLILEGYDPVFFWGDYNQYTQEILDESSPLHAFGPDLVLILIRMEDSMPDFVHRFGEKEFSFWQKEIEESARHLNHLVTTLNEKRSVQILLQNMAAPETPYWGVYDAQEPFSQTDLVFEMNQRLKQGLASLPTAFLWDYNQFLIRKGFESLYDEKMAYVARNPFRQAVYPDIAQNLMCFILSILGKGKKCIVLDLDNTLWGGIVGEDGFNGIALGHDYPGACYVDFQRELLKLYHRGIILAINSKNNETDAFEVIDGHPDMLLRRHHFAAFRINWEDKASNLRQLAEEINIGIDSMIFLDDNPVECELVRRQCPECTVVQVPDKPYRIPALVRTLQGIENIRLTGEDKKKGEMYQAQTQRENLKKFAGDLAGFLKELETEIEIRRADAFTTPRIAQLTQKTNQFNMTMRRYTEADIQAMDAAGDYIFSVSAQDRFGDNGIIGVLILKPEGEACRIDIFLLSCRVISRTIEQTMLAFIAEFAEAKGFKRIVGEFSPTEKNKPVADFYLRMNFRPVGENWFDANLSERHFMYSPYVRHHIVQ